MNRIARSVAVAGSAALVLALTTAIPQALAKDGTPANGVSAAQLAEEQALLPLRDLASAVGEQGRGSYSDTYANLSIDRKNNQVTVYTTDPGRGQEMVKAAKRAHGNVDTSKVKYLPAKYTKKQIDDSIGLIMTATKPADAAHVEVYSAASAPDGSGIQVVVAKSAVDHVKAELAGNSVPVTVTAGDPITPIAWRWDDPSPFIGGDVLVGPAHQAGYTAQCTAGIAAEDSSGGDYLITADHCFATGSGNHVYGEGDAVGNWQLNYGSFVGDVGNDQPQWDAQAIWTRAYNGAGTNSDEADQPQGQWYQVTSDAYSYNGDSVCQDGARSYYDGYGVPCGITVTNQDVYYRVTWDDGTVHTVRGVQGQSSGWMAEPGDSGALVFSISGSNTRQARGIASAIGGGNFFWTEAPDILNAFNLHLNPHV